MLSLAALLSLVNADGLSLDDCLLADGVLSSLNGAVMLGAGDGLGLYLGCINCNEYPDVVLVK